MYYFSELYKKKVITDKSEYLGIFTDFIFLYSENQTITKLVVEKSDDSRIIIPIAYLRHINKEIQIASNYKNSPIEENEVSTLKNLLDKQIIDLVGNKVVRVNDVVIQNIPLFCISGVDIGILGIFRRIGLEKALIKLHHIMGFKLTPKILSWGDIQSLELSRGIIKLKKKEEKLNKINPEDLADYLEKTNLKNVAKILDIIDESKAIKVINSLNINYQQGLFSYFSPQKAGRIISLLDRDEAVDVLLTLNKKKQTEILHSLDSKTKAEIEYLISLSSTPIGEVITTEYFFVGPNNTVREVISRLRRETMNFSFLTYVYVLNEHHQLVGVFNLHELLLQQSDTPVYKFMLPNCIVVHLTTPEEIVLKKMIRYKLFALPVINKDKKLLGIVTFDDVSDLLLAKMA